MLQPNPTTTNPTSLLPSNEDELKSELRNLRQWKLRMEGAMQSAAQILREWNTSTDESIYSGAMEWLLGIFPHEIAGQFEIWMLLIHPDDRAAYRKEIKRVLSQGGPFQAEYRARKRSGQYTILLERGYFIASTEGSGDVLSSVITDVADLREMEARLSQSQRAEAFSKLTGGVAHDFNNMLSVVIGYSQILIDEMHEKGELVGFVEEIEKAALRASSLTNQLLAFSNPPAIRRSSLQIGELLNDVVKMLRRLLGEQIQLAVEIGTDLPVVSGDRSQFEQVFINLAVAAREAMPQGGQLRIRVFKEIVSQARVVSKKNLPLGNYTCVSLAFSPILGRGESKTLGKALGKNRNLSTAAAVLEENDGRLDLSLISHTPSRLNLFLPGVRETQKPSDRQALEITSSPATILLVEDDSAIRNFARTVLQRLGHKIVEADDGETALSMFESDATFSPDLVLTDMVMPRLGGLQLARKIEKKHPGPVFLLTSGYPDQQEIAKEHDADFAFLKKPFSVGDLISKVGSLLEGRSPQQ